MQLDKVYGFLKDLRDNNNREWFNANKDRYIEAKDIADNFTLSLINAVASIDPEASVLTPSDCTYRIYRDTRFSADKTPYKTHIGIFICPGGNKKSYRCGYYIHLEPGNSFVGGGCWCPPAPLLREIRQSIYDNIEEYLDIINAPEFRRLYKEVGSDPLKTAPKGFPKDWEYIDLIKPRDYTVMAPVTDSFMQSADAVNDILGYIRIQQPFKNFINYIFEEKPWLSALSS